jgi:cell division protein FtsQ
VRALKGDRTAGFSQSEAALLPLPRPLRIAVRFARRLFSGNVAVPRHLGVASAAAFLAMTGAYGAWQSGNLPGMVSETAARAGLTINSVRISGHQRTTQAEVLAALGFDNNPSIIGLDVEAARARLLQLPWVASASVAKALPGSVSVELVEKRAGGIWQNGAEVLALDVTGAPIGPARLAGDRALPAFVGEGADKLGLAFAAEVGARAPLIVEHVKVHIRVSERRWDLLLDNGMTVRLPETGQGDALAELNALQAGDDIIGRDISAVDFRVKDRTIVALGETAMAALFPDPDAVDAAKKTGATQ